MKKLFTLLLITTFNYCFAQPNGNWLNVTSDGFNDYNNNYSVASLKTFKGYLYAGTGGPNAANFGRIYRSQTGDPGAGSWAQVYDAGAKNNILSVMAVYADSVLYVSGNTQSYAGKVYQTTDGINYRSFWDVDTPVSHIVSFKGTSASDSIFICRYNGPGDEIYKADPYVNDSMSQNPFSFRLVKAFPGEVITAAKAVTVGGNQILFVATKGNTSYYPYLYKSTDGITFTKIGTHLNDAGSNVFIGGHTSYTGISSIEQNGNTLFFGTKGNLSNPADYYHSTDMGNTWNAYAPFSGFDEMPCMYNHNNELWFALADYQSGVNKIQINRGLTGDKNSYSGGNMGHISNYGINGCMEFFKNQMYYGFQNTGIGGQLNRLNLCNFAVNPVLTSSQTICQGDTIKLKANPSSGVPPFNFTWTIKGVNYSTTDSSYNHSTIATDGNHPITLTATDSIGCTATGSAGNVSVGKSTNIVIYVSCPDGPVTSGSVVIYKDTSKTAGVYSIDTARIETTNVAGEYTFTNVLSGNYWIKVFPDTLLFPDLIPTYYGNGFQWDSIKVSGKLMHDCYGMDTIGINVIKIMSTPSGNGRLRGRVVEGVGYHRSPTDPIPGADVKVGRKPPGGNIAATTTTDTIIPLVPLSGGWFEFGNLPYNIPGEKYVIYIDIPGYGLDSAREVVLDSLNPQQLQLNYYVDSNTIWMDSTIYPTGIVSSSYYNENKLSAYPNPTKNNANINYALNSEAYVRLTVFNILGMEIETLVNTKQAQGNYSLLLHTDEKYASGIYFIQLTVDGKRNITKLVIEK